VANPRVKTDKIDAAVLAALGAADFLPEIGLPDRDTKRLRRYDATKSSGTASGSRTKCIRSCTLT
jgi:transposase